MKVAYCQRIAYTQQNCAYIARIDCAAIDLGLAEDQQMVMSCAMLDKATQVRTLRALRVIDIARKVALAQPVRRTGLHGRYGGWSPGERPGDVVTPDEREPDYRFTLANERTFLAWIRTSLALLAGGVALMQLVPRFSVQGVRHIFSLLLVTAGGTLALLAVNRWRRVQLAMRQGANLPVSRTPLVLGIAMTVVSIMLAVLVVVAPPAGG